MGYAGRHVFRQIDVHSGTETYEAIPLAALQMISLCGIADDPPRDQTCNLGEDYLRAGICFQDDTTLLILEGSFFVSRIKEFSPGVERFQDPA
mgnify:CR=1 FL=1